MEGGGSEGEATKLFSAYGFTKAGIPQLNKSLQAEVKAREGALVSTQEQLLLPAPLGGLVLTCGGSAVSSPLAPQAAVLPQPSHAFCGHG